MIALRPTCRNLRVTGYHELFDQIENDQSSLHSIGVNGLLGAILVKQGIHSVADLVAEFRRAEPFGTVDGIGRERELFLKGCLYDHAARTNDPRALIRFFL